VAGHNIAEGCGGSVASRGLMWSNSHPAPKRWLPLKGPLWFTVARAVQANFNQLQEASGVNTAPWYASFGIIAFLCCLGSFASFQNPLNPLPISSHLWLALLQYLICRYVTSKFVSVAVRYSLQGSKSIREPSFVW